MKNLIRQISVCSIAHTRRRIVSVLEDTFESASSGIATGLAMKIEAASVSRLEVVINVRIPSLHLVIANFYLVPIGNTKYQSMSDLFDSSVLINLR